MCVRSLAWETTDESLRAYFERFGEVTTCTVKRGGDGRSRGFGFVNFASKDVTVDVLNKTHVVDGRRLDILPPRVTNLAETTKVFVGRLDERVPVSAIRAHFARFGDVTDVYLPMPHKGFCFVTYADNASALAALSHGEAVGEDGRGGVAGGSSLHRIEFDGDVATAQVKPPTERRPQYDRNASGGGTGGGSGGPPGRFHGGRFGGPGRGDGRGGYDNIAWTTPPPMWGPGPADDAARRHHHALMMSLNGMGPGMHPGMMNAPPAHGMGPPMGMNFLMHADGSMMHPDAAAAMMPPPHAMMSHMALSGGAPGPGPGPGPGLGGGASGGGDRSRGVPPPFGVGVTGGGGHAHGEGGFALYVSNVAWEAGWQDLKDHFARFGRVSFADVARDRDTGRSLGRGIVRFDDEASARRAIVYGNGTVFMGREINVREDRMGRGGHPPPPDGGGAGFFAPMPMPSS